MLSPKPETSSSFQGLVPILIYCQKRNGMKFKMNLDFEKNPWSCWKSTIKKFCAVFNWAVSQTDDWRFPVPFKIGSVALSASSRSVILKPPLLFSDVTWDDDPVSVQSRHASFPRFVLLTLWLVVVSLTNSNDRPQISKNPPPLRGGGMTTENTPTVCRCQWLLGRYSSCSAVM